MSTLKSDLNKYILGLKGIKEYFTTNRELGKINDYTNFKWAKQDNFIIVVNSKGRELLFPNPLIEKALYTMLIMDGCSYILNNKLKVDKFEIYLNGKDYITESL